jgi:5'-deoxynucleotidase YfbR-like HD superfamily hydrolase
MTTRDLFSLVSSLSGVTRFSMLKMCHHETVLEHTGMIVCFCYVLASRLNDPRIEHGITFDIGTLLSKATVHDWDETITGDVARPTKYFSSTIREELHKLELNGVADIAHNLNLPNCSVHHAQSKDGPEGSLVKLCDIACAIHRCWEEALIYNNMHFVLPANRLRVVLRRAVKDFELGQMSHAQWQIIDSFVLDLDRILNKILQQGNGELKEMTNAN